MGTVVLVLASVLLISLISFVGVVGLSVGRKRLQSLLLALVAFASGSLLAAAFYHMIPESVSLVGAGAFNVILFGILFFFVVEKFIHWHHCGREDCNVRPVGYLNLLGDGLHNFIDGVVVAAAYMTSTQVGFITTLAIALHEIPQEFGDFSVLLHAGMSVRKALSFNFLSASTAIVGALLGLMLFGFLESWIPYVVAFAGGGFIYIATADLMPELHKEKEFPKLLRQVIALFIGVLVIYAASNIMPE